MLLDPIHHWTGIRRPDFDYAQLECNIQAFDLLVRHHYDYYKASALWRCLHKADYADLRIMPTYRVLAW